MRLYLRALGHPQADSVQMDAFRNLVMWLEDRKIRAWKVEDRQLLATSDATGWQAVFDKARPPHRSAQTLPLRPRAACTYTTPAYASSIMTFICLVQYLQDVTCPPPVRGAGPEAHLLWLLRLAVAREYEDTSEQRTDGV